MLGKFEISVSECCLTNIFPTIEIVYDYSFTIKKHDLLKFHQFFNTIKESTIEFKDIDE